MEAGAVTFGIYLFRPEEDPEDPTLWAKSWLWVMTEAGQFLNTVVGGETVRVGL